MQIRPTQGASYTLGFLLVIYVVNHIDRQVMYILAESVKLDLDLSDGQLGFLMGGGFAIFYAFAGLPIARLADRGDRSLLISIALLIWSAMTVASGMATNFVQLLLARIGVGVGEAGCTPPAHSILSDTYPPERRSFALSVYQLGVPLGILFGFSAGGILTDELGWRTAFFVVGAPGVILAVIARMTLEEPARGRFDEGASNEVVDILQRMRELAVQSSSETLASVERSYIQDEYVSLRSEISRISSVTEFNGLALADGSDTSLNVQVGIQNTSASRIQLTLGDLLQGTPSSV